MNQNFADLLAPVASQLFFAEHWEAKPLHIRRNDEHFYGRLISNRDVETLITSGGLRFPAIQLARDGAFFAAESFTRNIRSGEDVFAGVPDIARIKKAYGVGATISLPGIHRSWKPLADLVAAIEEEFGHAAHANIYITPGNAKGFTPHYDTHEVFVLQIAGHKHWLVSEPPIPLPHRTQPCSPRGCGATPPVVEAEMKPGDLLYAAWLRPYNQHFRKILGSCHAGNHRVHLDRSADGEGASRKAGRAFSARPASGIFRQWSKRTSAKGKVRRTIRIAPAKDQQ